MQWFRAGTDALNATCELDGNSTEAQHAPNAQARCVPLCENTWVVGLTVRSQHGVECKRPSTRFHFVLDNSGSMGTNSQHAKECFADLVALASGPCSLVAFDSTAKIVGDNFRSPAEFRAARLPPQGGTNITAGLEAAIDIIKRIELKEADEELDRTHNVLVLLSDGAHVTGPRPEQRLPVLGEELRAKFPALRLSVVVVGVTRNSDTSMGMLMKQSLETVALPALEPIYFASTPTMMGEVLSQMNEGLACLQGSVVTVSAPSGCLFVRAVGEAGVPSIDLLVENHEQGLLCVGNAPPNEVQVDGAIVPCAAPPTESVDFDTDLASMALQHLVDAVRVRRVAVGANGARLALEQLHSWIFALETRAAAADSSVKFCLARATPAERLAQHKALKRTTQGAKELFNQLAEIEAHNTNDSASQAAFLTGARSKYGAKALVRASANRNVGEDPAARLKDLVVDIERIAPKMRQALRADFCDKLSGLSTDTFELLRERLVAVLRGSVQISTIDSLCNGGVTCESLEADPELAKLVDSGAAVESLLTVTGRERQSYLSLYSAWEQLSDWCDCAENIAGCNTEYELLMCLGVLGYPVEVRRRAATQMDPYAMDITCVRAAPADTASLSTALYSDQSIVPPEGGTAVQDLLVLVDPDVPRASRLAAQSMLLREAYTSVVMCRDLHMYIGNNMRIALHAHALLAVVQPPLASPRKQDLEAQLRRQYLGRAFQCGECGFGPIDHFACGDLEAHHGEDVGGAKINNACPRCDWFSESLHDWPKWDGTVPIDAQNAGVSETGPVAGACMTAASVDIALRICYSARVLWQSGPDSDAHTLCEKLANWESLTAADGVDHPVQLLLALAVADDVPDTALGLVPTLALLNEVCARRARGELQQIAGTEAPAVMAAARKRVAGFLGVTDTSAPYTRPLEESEPSRQSVMETCCAAYDLESTAFDFKEWVRDALQPWTPALIFVKRLRSALQTREGGWPQLHKDMEAGPQAYADLARVLQMPAGSKETLRAFLDVRQPSAAPRVLATVAAQAFLQQSSQLRRTIALGGTLVEPLGDVRDSNTLRALCVEVRMATYEERVASKMREWGQVGTSLVLQRAKAVDLDQYSHMCGSHVHGLDKQTFWGLWHAAKGEKAEKAREFLSSANQGFVAKYGTRPRR